MSHIVYYATLVLVFMAFNRGDKLGDLYELLLSCNYIYLFIASCVLLRALGLASNIMRRNIVYIDAYNNNYIDDCVDIWVGNAKRRTPLTPVSCG